MYDKMFSLFQENILVGIVVICAKLDPVDTSLDR